MLHMDVAKVDWDVAYVASVSNECCKIAAAIGPLPLVNSTHQRASIFPSRVEMLHCAESACCKCMFQVF
jgi:hypothetical protein